MAAKRKNDLIKEIEHNLQVVVEGKDSPKKTKKSVEEKKQEIPTSLIDSKTVFVPIANTLTPNGQANDLGATVGPSAKNNTKNLSKYRLKLSTESAKDEFLEENSIKTAKNTEEEMLTRRERLKQSKLNRKLEREKLKLELERFKLEKSELKTKQDIMKHAGLNINISNENSLIKLLRIFVNIPSKLAYAAIDAFKILAICLLLTIVAMYFINTDNYNLQTVIPDLLKQITYLFESFQPFILKTFKSKPIG